MKKGFGLCLVALLSAASVFASDDGRRDRRREDPSIRLERMIMDLKLDEKQAAEFRKLHEEYRNEFLKEQEAMRIEREKRRERMRAMREAQNAAMRKLLSEEQYRLYLDRQQPGPAPDDSHRERHGRR